MLQVLAAITILYSCNRSPETCKSCGKLFDDGVVCRSQGCETFKNETHIRNGVHFEAR